MRNRTTIIAGLLALILLIGGVYTFYIKPQYYRFNGGEAFFSTSNKVLFEDRNRDMYVYKDAIYVCNKDGLIKYAVDGEIIWSKSFYIESPKFVYLDGYMAVADIMARKAYVFDEAGMLYEVDESWPIIDLRVNANGYLLVVTENDESHIINYYNEEGVVAIKRSTQFEKDGYPIAVVPSPDITKIASVYLDIASNHIKSIMTFFNFETSYDHLAENIIGGETIDDMLPADLLWLDNTHLVVIMDKALSFYSFEDDSVELLTTITNDAKLVDVDHTQDTLVVQYGEALDSSSLYANSITAFDLSGEQIMQKHYDSTIRGISANKDNYYVMIDGKIIQYEKGSRIWFTNTHLSVKDFYQVNRTTFVAQTELGYEILNLEDQ